MCQACKPKTLCCVQAHGEIRLAGRMKAFALGDNNNSGRVGALRCIEKDEIDE